MTDTKNKVFLGSIVPSIIDELLFIPQGNRNRSIIPPVTIRWLNDQKCPYVMILNHDGDFSPDRIPRTNYIIIQIRICTRCRSEEHTSELQSRGHLVCRLLLEKKNYTIRTPV